jgi:chromosomal replication initiation ATPase DnaA
VNKIKARKHYQAYMSDGALVKQEDVYATIDQRLLGDERFIEKVIEKHEGDIKKERRKKEYSLLQIARVLEKQYKISLDDMRSSGRTRSMLTARRLFSILAKEYGYKGREIAGYLHKDPAAVTGYLRSREDVRKQVEEVVVSLKKG